MSKDWRNAYREFEAVMALSGDVYIDKKEWIWFEMSAGSTIYHYGRRVPLPDKAEVVKNAAVGQKHVPVFKLVAPDSAGGSMELCIYNWQLYRSFWDVLRPTNWVGPATSGKKSVGHVGQWVDIRRKVVFDEEYRGSYNYAETVTQGFDEHDRLDIQPHKHTYRFYVNPPKGQRVEKRKFPANDHAGRQLASQI